MNNYVEDYSNMVNNFRTNDLQALLGAFGRNKAGRKSELKERALELVRARSTPNFNHQSFLAKISEIARNQSDLPNNNNDVMRLMQNHQRQQMMAMNNIPVQQQRMYQPPQYPQQQMLMTRAGLPQVMPQMQRGMYGNTVSANTMANNNIHYISSNYQMAGPRTIASQLPSNQMSVGMAQQAAVYDLNAQTADNNSFIPSTYTLSNLKFKKLPFYDVYFEVMKPTVITGLERCTLLNAPRGGIKEGTFKIVMTSEQANIISMNRDTSNGKCEYVYQLQLRICQLEPGVTDVSDFMPLGLHVRINGKSNTLPPAAPNTRPGTETRRTSRPINITSNLKISAFAQNSITINWTPDQKNYAMGMYVVQKLTTETLIQKLKDKGLKSSEETKNYIIKKLTDVDPDLATTSYRFSLVCPLSKMRMKIPAKSIHCDHLQCFDACTFILMNEKKPTWMCPTCNKSCLYEDIQIQNYFMEVVTSDTLKDCIKEIEILADGTWIVYEENKDTKNTNSTPDTKEKPIDSVNLDDSDDEKSVDTKKESRPESFKCPESESLKSCFIDLTISDEDDDDDDSSEKDKQENEALAADNIEVITVIDYKPQAQVQPQQAVTSSEQGVVIELDSPSPPMTPTPTSPTPTSPIPASPTLTIPSTTEAS